MSAMLDLFAMPEKSEVDLLEILAHQLLAKGEMSNCDGHKYAFGAMPMAFAFILDDIKKGMTTKEAIARAIEVTK